MKVLSGIDSMERHSSGDGNCVCLRRYGVYISSLTSTIMLSLILHHLSRQSSTKLEASTNSHTLPLQATHTLQRQLQYSLVPHLSTSSFMGYWPSRTMLAPLRTILPFTLLILAFHSTAGSAAPLWIRRDASLLEPRADSNAYLDYARDSTYIMNEKYYSSTSGTWNGQWWQSGNALTVIGDLVLADESYKADAIKIFDNTLQNAPGRGGGPGFTNKFFDDMGWWALGWIKAYDVTQDSKYLSTAQDVFVDMLRGLGATCGGIWWSKDYDKNTAIANELFLAVAASLANRVPGGQANGKSYLDYALEQWDFFKNGNGNNILDSNNGMFHDGLNLEPTSNMFCKSGSSSAQFSYNQGVILGAMIELNKAHDDSSYLDYANARANAALEHLSSDDILVEFGGDETPDSTIAQFKGVFARNLMYLQQATGSSTYASYLIKWADSIYANNRDAQSGLLGPNWEGPYQAVSFPSHQAAVSALIGAAVASK